MSFCIEPDQFPSVPGRSELELERVVQLRPDDRLSAELLKMLRGRNDEATAPPPATTAEPAGAVQMTADGIAGAWKATRDDGSTFALEMSRDGKFTWNYAQQDVSHTMSGTYTVAGGVLVLTPTGGGSGAMAGTLTPLEGGGFNFRITGGPAEDPGLDYRPQPRQE